MKTVARVAICLAMGLAGAQLPAQKACEVNVVSWPPYMEQSHADYPGGKEEAEFINQVALHSPGAVKVTSLADMVEQVGQQLNQNECGCMGELRIYGHGNSGFVEVGRDYWEWRKRSSWPEELQNLKGAFCPDAKVYFMSCCVGCGPEGREFTFEVAKMWNVTVRANGSETYPTTDPGALPLTATPEAQHEQVDCAQLCLKFLFPAEEKKEED